MVPETLVRSECNQTSSTVMRSVMRTEGGRDRQMSLVFSCWSAWLSLPTASSPPIFSSLLLPFLLRM